MRGIQKTNKKRCGKKKIAVLIFLFLLTGNASISQEISTTGEIYDFETGDIFHFGESTSSTYKISNIEILNKYYSVDHDTVYYVRKINAKRNSQENPSWIFENYIDTVNYFNLDSLVNQGDINTVYSTEELYNNRLINFKYYSGPGYEYSYRFVAGCGVARYHYYGWDGSTSWEMADKLVYFKKGDEIWGLPNPVSVSETNNLSLISYFKYFCVIWQEFNSLKQVSILFL